MKVFVNILNYLFIFILGKGLVILLGVFVGFIISLNVSVLYIYTVYYHNLVWYFILVYVYFVSSNYYYFMV